MAVAEIVSAIDAVAPALTGIVGVVGGLWWGKKRVETLEERVRLHKDNAEKWEKLASRDVKAWVQELQEELESTNKDLEHKLSETEMALADEQDKVKRAGEASAEQAQQIKKLVTKIEDLRGQKRDAMAQGKFVSWLKILGTPITTSEKLHRPGDLLEYMKKRKINEDLVREI